MKILHVGTELTWRGGENQIRLLIEGLKAQGIKNFVAYPRGSQGLERLAKIVPTLELPSRSPLDPRNILKLINYCRAEQINIIDSHSGNGHALALRVKKRIPALKVVVHRRVDNPIKNRWLTRRKYHSALVDQFVGISSCIGKMLVEYGVPKDRVTVVPSAVDPSPYERISRDQARTHYLQEFGLKPSTVLLGNASALTSQKGYEYLLEAVAILKNQQSDFFCLIAGDGVLREPLEKQCRELGLSECVRFLGFIPNIAEFLAALDILAVPSVNEGLGTLILEGIYAGCAVVASRVGGIPEMIVHEKTGLLVEPRESQELAAALKRLMGSADLRQRLSVQAQVQAREHFSLKAMVGGNLAVYQRLLQV